MGPVAWPDDDPDVEGSLMPAAPLRGPSGSRCSLQPGLCLGGLLLATLGGAALVARRAGQLAEAEEQGLILRPKRLLSQRPCMKGLEGAQIDSGFFAKIDAGCGEGAAGPEAPPPGVEFLRGEVEEVMASSPQASSSFGAHSERRAEVDAGLRWEVMAEEVNVRASPSLDAESLGKKIRGEKFFGELDGDWIRLTPQLVSGNAYVKAMWADVYLVAPAVQGNRSHCANAGRSCSDSRCCRWPGHACFKKNDFWSACRGSCAEGPDPTDSNGGPWSCERLGEAAPGRPVDGELSRPVAGWVQDLCAAGSDSCSESRCCSAPGFQCYERKRGEAACRRACPAGGWTCAELGARTPEAASSSAAATASV